MIYPNLDNNKANRSNISDIKDELKICFWYKSANKKDSSFEKEKYSNIKE